LAKKIEKILGVTMGFFFKFSAEIFLLKFLRFMVGTDAGELNIVFTVVCSPFSQFIVARSGLLK